MKSRFFYTLISFTLIFLISCSDDPEGFDGEFQVVEKSAVQWWLLIAGNESIDPGIYLYNISEDTIERSIPLPDNIQSPEALDFDGEFLWLGGTGENESIYKIDPLDGTVLSTIPNLPTVSIAADRIDSTMLWVAGDGRIDHITKEGTFQESLVISIGKIEDIAVLKNRLFYIYDGDIDPIVEVDKETGEELLIFDTFQENPYAFTTSGTFYVVVGEDNAIRQYDIYTNILTNVYYPFIDSRIIAIAPN